MAQAQKKAEKPISAAQVKRIHTIKSILRLSEDNYRDCLESRFGVRSCKDLTLMQAKSFLDELERVALNVEQDLGQKRHKEATAKAAANMPKKFDDLDNRPDMASGAQLRKIEAMWQDLSIIPEAEPRARALRRFIQRVTGVMGLRFLTSQDAGKILNALGAMEKRETQKGKNAKN